MQAGAADSTRMDLADQVVKAEAALQASHVILQSSNQLNARLSEILESAGRAALSVNEMTSGEIAEGDYFTSVPLMLSGRGTYPDCGRFLHELASAMPDVRVTAFELVSNSASGDATCNFLFDLQWYAAPLVADAR